MFGGQGLQGQPYGYSLRNIFEVSYTEEGIGSGNGIFEGVFNFSASEARKKLDSTYSVVKREEYRSASPSTQEHQNLECKLNLKVN